jgi:hypothetical protein
MACPDPTAMVFTKYLVSFWKTGNNTSSSPESCVLVVVARTMAWFPAGTSAGECDGTLTTANSAERKTARYDNNHMRIAPIAYFLLNVA